VEVPESRDRVAPPLPQRTSPIPGRGSAARTGTGSAARTGRRGRLERAVGLAGSVMMSAV